MKIRQAETAVAFYSDPENEGRFTGYSEKVLRLFTGSPHDNFTLLEVVTILNEDPDCDVSDSTISPRLHELKAAGIITDDLPKRICRVHPIRKKVWRLADGACSKLTFKNAGAR